MTKKPKPCEWVTLKNALETFVMAEGGTESSGHILAMHWHVASRLVVEGGFHPDHIRPRPPFVIKKRKGANVLEFSPTAGGVGEATVLGGLKTKNIDVVVTLPRVGPCLAVSMKGSLNAFRNLTNRLEEAIGDCTNIHLSYPVLVYGFLHVFCANREGAIPQHLSSRLDADPKTGQTKAADIAVRASGDVSEFITAYHEAMARLTGRKDLRDEVSRYEAIALVLADPAHESLGRTLSTYPASDSPLRISAFFDSLYKAYDLRYVYAARALQSHTRRLFWDPESPAIWDPRTEDLSPRISSGDGSSDDITEPENIE
ncbi:MAG: hypothetical protein ABL971_13925 [Vicinamibacterales bacterium]